jgi:hypothetical protein
MRRVRENHPESNVSSSLKQALVTQESQPGTGVGISDTAPAPVKQIRGLYTARPPENVCLY